MSDSSVYVIASGKGGVGKTTTAVALSACTAAAGRATVLVDADLGMPDVATFLALDESKPTLHDVLAGDADLDDAVRSVGGFDALPGGTSLDGYAGADPAGLREVVADLRDRYEVVVLDVGAGLSHDTVVPLGLADRVVLVSTPDDVALGNTATTREIADRVDADVAGVVLTRTVVTDAEVPGDLDARLLGAVPRDEAVREAASAGDPLPVAAPDSPATGAYCDITASLLGIPVTSIDFDADGTSDETDGTSDETDAAASEGIDSADIPFSDDESRTGPSDGEAAELVTEAEPAESASADDATAGGDDGADEEPTGTGAAATAGGDVPGESSGPARERGGERDADEDATDDSGMLSRLSGLLK